MVKSNFRRVLRKVTRPIKKRYFKGKGYNKPKLSQMARDLAIVKSMVNAEKEVYLAHQTVGTGVNLSQPYIEPISNITEGTAHGQRDGQSVKLHGYRWNLRFVQQSSTAGPIYVKYWLVKYVGPRGTTPSISTFLKTDFDGNHSAMSAREEDHYTSYRVITAGSCRIGADNLTGQSMYTLKSNYGKFTKGAHQRYSSALSTSLLTDQMYVIAVTSAGVSGTQTGFNFDSQLLISYYDN